MVAFYGKCTVLSAYTSPSLSAYMPSVYPHYCVPLTRSHSVRHRDKRGPSLARSRKCMYDRFGQYHSRTENTCEAKTNPSRFDQLNPHFCQVTSYQRCTVLPGTAHSSHALLFLFSVSHSLLFLLIFHLYRTYGRTSMSQSTSVNS